MKIRFLWWLKTLPFLGALFFLLFYFINNQQNTNWSDVRHFSGTSISTTVVFYAASIELKFCNIHRAFIVYNGINTVWLDWRRLIPVDISTWVTIGLVCLGLILFLILFRFLLKKKKEAH